MKDKLIAQVHPVTTLSANTLNNIQLGATIERGSVPTEKLIEDKFFEFSQAVASREWHIRHNLNKYPSVMVVNSANDVVIGEITYISENELIIYFTGAFVGKAYLN